MKVKNQTGGVPKKIRGGEKCYFCYFFSLEVDQFFSIRRLIIELN